MDELPSITSESPNMSNSIGKLGDALAKAQGIMETAIKSATNPYFKSHYADLASVWEVIRDPLSTNGLSVIQLTEGDTQTVEVTTLLIHSSGEWIRSIIRMRPVKADPQGIGSCITYARRYALMAMVGVATEDDDGNAASEQEKEARNMDSHVREIARPPMQSAPKPQGVDQMKIQLLNKLIGKGKPFGNKIADAKRFMEEVVKTDFDKFTLEHCTAVGSAIEKVYVSAK